LVTLGDTATGLIPIVVSGHAAAPSKIKLQFGHHVTKTISKHHGASSLFYSQSSVDFNLQFKIETNLWNPSAVASLEFSFDQLLCLQSSPVGGLLLILTHWNSSDTKLFGDPVVRIVACPALATLGQFGKDDFPGINLHEAWDPLVVPISEMPTSDTSCPLLVSSGGFSRHVSYPPTIANFIEAVAPLFISSGEDIASTVTTTEGTTCLRAFFLPEHFHFPIGMSWQLRDLTVSLMSNSVKALTKKSGAHLYVPFLAILTLREPLLEPWLAAAQAHPSEFSLQPTLTKT
jgi:hypothetical protein